MRLRALVVLAVGGRAIYTEMGHTMESYADPLFRRHLAGAIRWAAGRL